MAIIPAFQAGDGGSIPLARSKKSSRKRCFFIHAPIAVIAIAKASAASSGLGMAFSLSSICTIS